LALSRSIELRLDLPPEVPEILADRDRLLQVFDNLIGNAAKFTPAGGCVTVGAAVRDTDVLLWVGDTGSGSRSRINRTSSIASGRQP
jgi:signal transduction histidine kinase